MYSPARNLYKLPIDGTNRRAARIYSSNLHFNKLVTPASPDPTERNSKASPRLHEDPSSQDRKAQPIPRNRPRARLGRYIGRNRRERSRRGGIFDTASNSNEILREKETRQTARMMYILI